ncbi:hypothetical protein [Brenneria corticis]|uniref:hypothetical protein n=1 Tax=Brenneria corticis TaxID=2173106 RepID=UPI001AEFCE56|nr:hypothetical protein [Brenneria sp. CFCC 11842]
MTNEVKRKCVRATERAEEAWSVNREPMDKNRIEGVAEQGERAINRKALMGLETEIFQFTQQETPLPSKQKCLHGKHKCLL